MEAESKPEIPIVGRPMERRFPGISGSRIRKAGIVQRGLLLISIAFIPMVLEASSDRKQETDEESTAPRLTEEEKEIMRHREILENLILLQNFDAIEFMEILNQMEPGWSEREESDEGKESPEEDDKP